MSMIEDSTVTMNTDHKDNGRSNISAIASYCVHVADGDVAVVADAAIENNRDYDNGEIMIGTDTNTIYDNERNNCTVAMRANETCSVRQKKRKQINELIVVAGGDDIDGGIDCFQYKIIERDCKRQKIEIKKKRDNCDTSDCNGNPVHADQVAGNQMRPVKPPVPPKPKNLVCRPPQFILDNSKIKVKLESTHAITVQKLNAQAEQLRHEIINLKAALGNERNAVRTLR